VLKIGSVTLDTGCRGARVSAWPGTCSQKFRFDGFAPDGYGDALGFVGGGNCDHFLVIVASGELIGDRSGQVAAGGLASPDVAFCDRICGANRHTICVTELTDAHVRSAAGDGKAPAM